MVLSAQDLKFFIFDQVHFMSSICENEMVQLRTEVVDFGRFFLVPRFPI